MGSIRLHNARRHSEHEGFPETSLQVFGGSLAVVVYKTVDGFIDVVDITIDQYG